MTQPLTSPEIQEPRKQFNIAIDHDLHKRLRLQAIARGQSLRDFGESVLRKGLAQSVGASVQDLGHSCTDVPVETEE